MPNPRIRVNDYCTVRGRRKGGIKNVPVQLSYVEEEERNKVLDIYNIVHTVRPEIQRSINFNDVHDRRAIVGRCRVASITLTTSLVTMSRFSLFLLLWRLC
jgi:hypothetical protein